MDCRPNLFVQCYNQQNFLHRGQPLIYEVSWKQSTVAADCWVHGPLWVAKTRMTDLAGHTGSSQRHPDRLSDQNKK